MYVSESASSGLDGVVAVMAAGVAEEAVPVVMICWRCEIYSGRWFVDESVRVYVVDA